MDDHGQAPGARDRDIGEAAFLLEALHTAFVERALRREQAFLPADQEDRVVFETLGGVDGHDRDLRILRAALVVHHQRDVFEEGAERVVFLHRADEFAEVLQAPGRLDRFLGLVHRGVAALVEQLPREFGVRQAGRHVAPAGDVADQPAERLLRCPGQFVGVEDAGGGRRERCAGGAGELVDARDRLVAKAALGDVDDAFEGEVVRRLVDHAEVRQRVADFGAFVEAEAADDLVRHADRDEAVLELAGLVLRADQDRDLVERFARAPDDVDFLADAARLFGAVPDADDLDLLADVALGPELLAKAPAIVGDHARRGAEDVRRAAVILFEADDLSPRKVALELQDVLDLRTAPRIDRLVVVADAGDVLALLREQPQPEILRRVGVLILVDHDVFEALLILREHVAVRLQDDEHVEQQVAEIARVERDQPRLVLLVQLAAAAVGVALALARIDIGGDETLVLPLVDQPGEAARREALFVDVGGEDQLLE